MTRPSIRGAVVGAFLVCLLAACGSSANDFASKSPKDIVAAVVADMKALKSVKLSGSVTNGGQPVALDLSADVHGNCSGTIGMSGGTAQLLAVGGASYLKGDPAFWHGTAGSSADQVLALLGTKWAKMPSSSGFSAVCDLTKLFAKINDVKGTLAKGATSTIDGVKALEIISTHSDRTTHVFVAVDGAHYVLKATESGGSEPGTITLSNFNQPVAAKAPAATDVVDLTSFGG